MVLHFGKKKILILIFSSKNRFASRLVIGDPDFDRGTIFIVFFAVMSGATALGGALPHLAAISSAKGASKHVLKVINNVG